MKPYVDRLFESYKTTMPQLTANLTLQQWLVQGEPNQRSLLREIGQRAKLVCAINDTEVARLDWASFVYGGRKWVRPYLMAIPLLEHTAYQLDHNDQIFKQHMEDLATLANL